MTLTFTTGKDLDQVGIPCSIMVYSNPVDAAWTPWGAWASCSVSCGEGTRGRSRECQFAHPECKEETCSDKETGTSEVDKCFQTGAHSRNKKMRCFLWKWRDKSICSVPKCP